MGNALGPPHNPIFWQASSGWLFLIMSAISLTFSSQDVCDGAILHKSFMPWNTLSRSSVLIRAMVALHTSQTTSLGGVGEAKTTKYILERDVGIEGVRPSVFWTHIDFFLSIIWLFSVKTHLKGTPGWRRRWRDSSKTFWRFVLSIFTMIDLVWRIAVGLFVLVQLNQTKRSLMNFWSSS